MQPLRLLIADDEPLGAMALRSQLEALGHHVAAHARDGRHAVELARCFLVDLVILDFRMPGLTGLQAAERIFNARPLPVLVLSGFPEDTADRARPPAYHYLVKPVDTDALDQGIRAAHSAFLQWAGQRPDPDRQARLDHQARLIDRARSLLAQHHDTSQLAACRALLQRARDSGQPLHAVALSILQEAGESPDSDPVF